MVGLDSRIAILSTIYEPDGRGLGRKIANKCVQRVEKRGFASQGDVSNRKESDQRL